MDRAPAVGSIGLIGLRPLIQESVLKGEDQEGQSKSRRALSEHLHDTSCIRERVMSNAGGAG